MSKTENRIGTLFENTPLIGTLDIPVPEAKNIYSKAFSHLNEKDQKAMRSYQAAAQAARNNQIQPDPTVAIETLLKEVPGARKALKHYDKEVGKLMKWKR
ncbi:MAG TPA: hypothetical protein VKC54_04535 [Patescibacteria group bacterium]|nr:hypothetical protein [Patescibacteria group bacterium]